MQWQDLSVESICLNAGAEEPDLGNKVVSKVLDLPVLRPDFLFPCKALYAGSEYVELRTGSDTGSPRFGKSTVGHQALGGEERS